jgi:hypothetical protein
MPCMTCRGHPQQSSITNTAGKIYVQSAGPRLDWTARPVTCPVALSVGLRLSDKAYHTSHVYDTEVGLRQLRHLPCNGQTSSICIKSMWDVTVNGVSRNFIVSEPHERFSTADSTKIPFPENPGYLVHVAYTELDMECNSNFKL